MIGPLISFITGSLGRRLGRPTPFRCLPVMYFTSVSRGRILDEFPDLKVYRYYMQNHDRREVNPLLFGFEIPEAVRNSLECMAVRASQFFVFEYDESKGAQISDLLKARDGCWDHIRPAEDTLVIRYGVIEEFVQKGQPVAYRPLPNVFTRTEWDFIDRMASESAKGSEARFSRDEALVLKGLADREP
jgi:hypothetical protein